MTTNIKQIQQEIAKAQQTLKELQQKLEKEKNKKWEPKGGEWWVDYMGRVFCDNTNSTIRKSGLEFETKEAAEKAAIAYRRYHRLYKLAEELNEGWEPDWSDTSEKFYIYFNNEDKCYHLSTNNFFTKLSGVYFKSRVVAQLAIEIVKNGGLDG